DSGPAKALTARLEPDKRGAHADAEATMTPECEEVLAICRAVLETPLGPDDGFAEAGGHSILIARLVQKLQAAGWPVSVRALLSDSNTARKVARRQRVIQEAFAAPKSRAPSNTPGTKRDESAAEVLSVGYFTTLQVLFATLMYLPALAAFFLTLAYAEIGTF